MEHAVSGIFVVASTALFVWVLSVALISLRNSIRADTPGKIPASYTFPRKADRRGLASTSARERQKTHEQPRELRRDFTDREKRLEHTGRGASPYESARTLMSRGLGINTIHERTGIPNCELELMKKVARRVPHKQGTPN
jgi:hypothetical protein